MAKLLIPEATKIRRLAAALATMGRDSKGDTSSINLDQPLGMFFRQFPWDGRRRKVVGALPPLDLSTVGQYFARFDWEARPKPKSDRITEVEDEPGRVSKNSAVVELFPSTR
ncbi:MAG: hypothetical protein JJU11_01390 [Candidatus Sumerlaeia bacterium]|nr:hypothetical protein [Candidatus Sumerlaeia bacterium]